MSLELYLSVADKRLRTPTAVFNTSALPPLTPTIWSNITHYTRAIWLKEPRRAWHLLHVAQEVAARDEAIALEASITFDMARAANLWVERQLINTAVQRATYLFNQLNQPHWVAACQWQSLANPWLSDNFRQAHATLTAALPLIAGHPDTHPFTQRVHLSLAFVEILLGDYHSAYKQLEQLLTHPTTQISPAQQGQIHFTWAAGRRRQHSYAEAHHHATQAHACFIKADAPIFIYRSHIQLGYTVLAAQGQYQEAEEHFQTALNWFQQSGLTNWQSQAQQGLADVYHQQGRYQLAAQHLQEALHYNEQMGIQGATADILLDLSQLTAEQGAFQLSYHYAQRAYQINETVQGHTPNRIRAQAAKGVALAHQGYYQHALQELETAYTQAQAHATQHEDYAKLVVEISTPLARLWLWLGRLDYAQTYLHIPPQVDTNQLPLPDLLHWYLSQAELFLELKAFAQADVLLREGLQRAQAQQLIQFEAQFEQLWGRRYLLAGAYQTSETHFRHSQQLFAQMGRERDELDAKIQLGRLLQKQGEKEAAIEQLTAVLTRTADLPRLDWQAKTILAELTQKLGDYEQAIISLNHIRHQLQQPALNGPFLSYAEAVHLFEKAIQRAAQQGDQTRLWQFIEASKFKLSHLSTAVLPALSDQLGVQLRQEIERLNQSIATTKSLRRQREYYAQAKQLSQQYDQWLEQQRRQQLAAIEPATSTPALTATQFRQHAQHLWGEKWLAVNYFLTPETLFITWLTPEVQNSHHVLLDDHSHQLIQQIETNAVALSPEARQTLGHLLLPHEIQTHLTAETTLIIAPYGALHHIPWSALRINNQPLIQLALPLVLPSLSLVTQHHASQPPQSVNHQMLVVGVSLFDQQPYPHLPHVMAEVTTFPASNTTRLFNEQATWATLQQVMTADLPFGAWHLATHAFFDDMTNGRMSGFALYDRSIWLEDIEKLAHIPPFIFLSACSSLATHVYPGDELVSLALTFLKQGCNTVIGSLWSIEDEAAEKLTASFYQYWRGTTTAVEALTYAQRQAYLNREPLAHWAGFRIIGTGHQTPPFPPDDPL